MIFMKKLLLALILLMFLGSTAVWAQTRVITGNVSSASGEGPIPGVTVSVKGTTIGAITDAEGNYKITVPANANTLVFSYIGLKSLEVAIGNQSVVNAKMESDIVGLNEVVVTAIGIKRSEKSLGYSATQVRSEDITATRDRSVLNSLQGKIAGINISSASGAPGSSTRVCLRGYSSLGRSNQPLYVIDGVPISNSQIGSRDINGGTDFGNRANDINPDDIESVTILKGASGTALYGSRATNGVIVITTKKGTNRAGQGAVVELASSVSFDTPLRTPLLQNEFGQGWYDGTLQANLEENGSWGPPFDGKVRVWGHVVDNSQKIKPYVALPSNFRDFFTVGHTYDNSISITDGNDKSSYYLSYANVSSDGIMPTNADSYNRNTFSLKGSTKFFEKVTSSGSFNYINKKSSFVPTGQDQSVMDGLFQTPRDISIVDQKDYMDKFNNVDNYYTVYAQNPYFVLNEHGNDMTENRIYGNITLDYQALPWLNATFRAGTDVSNSQLKEWRAIVNSVRANYNNDPGRVVESSFFNQEINTDFFLTFNKKITEDFNINAILGHNFNQRQLRNQSSQVTGLDIPRFYQLSNSSATPVVDETSTERRLIGVYGSLDLSYRDLLFLTATARNDWSSTLPANNRSFFYPSVSMSFLLSDAVPSIQGFLPYAKLRAGYAQTGNDADPYLVNSVFTQADLFDGYRHLTFPLPGAINGFTISNRIGNPNLQPEIATEVEVGTDLRFLSNRIGIDFTVYNKTVKDLIWDATIARSTGYSAQTMNLGEISNKGIELLLTLVPVKTSNLEWRVSWNFSNNKNELVKLTEGLDQISLGGTSRLAFVSRPGYPIGLFEGSVQEYDPQGRIVVNNQGLPVPSTDKAIYGNAQYDYITGFNTSVTYKGFSLSGSVDIRHGGLMYSRNAELLYFTGNAPQTTFNHRQPFIIPNSVIKVDDGEGNITYVENDVPIAGTDNNLNLYYNQDYAGGQFERAFMFDKSFVKLRDVVLSYTLPKSFTTRLSISNVQLSVIGRNLLLWTPSDNIFVDPELTTFGNEIEADYGEYGATPSTRSFSASLRITF
jgi:TonB-linked SusC/RagA family outer membrane protein